MIAFERQEVSSVLCVSINLKKKKTKEYMHFTFEITEKACLWGRDNLFSANKLQGGFVAALINW